MIPIGFLLKVSLRIFFTQGNFNNNTSIIIDKFAMYRRTTVRNLRIREDTAKVSQRQYYKLLFHKKDNQNDRETAQLTCTEIKS